MALKFVLLTLLQQKPQTGYEIVQSFDSAIGYFWSASHQQVYRELGKMSEDGHVTAKLVKQTDKPDKKVYQISKTGVAALEEWLESPAKKTSTKDPLLVKLLNANAKNYTAMIAELNALHERCSEMLKVYKDIEKSYYSETQRQNLPTADLVLYIALRKGILGLQGQMKWQKEAISILEDLFK